ncbi:glycosyltransferase family 4 protein [Gracilibacillus sp. D59]|uniref:glycosyltransferase family 4 protein n=1 Tax=Gracilibacillus sp. D59 TaxID=3457434 RepID=UPI003FCC93B5
MKILITSEWYFPVINGVVTSIANLKRELERLGHEVRILTLSNQKRSYKKVDITFISSVGVGTIYPGARITLSTNDKHLKELIEWQPDVIHTQCEFSTFRLAKFIAKKLQIPIVHTYHTVYEDYTHYFSPNRKWGKVMVAIFTKKVLENATYVIAPTKKVNSLLKSYGITKEIMVVPTGIDLHKFTEGIEPNQKVRLKARLGIPSDQKLLLFVGRLAKEKNLEEIFTYIAKINHPNISLLIVGDGPHRNQLEKFTEKLHIRDRIIFTGMVPPDKIATYYKIADVFVSASNSETQGLTYIEALASGVPALCRKDPCLDNVITNGINGWQYHSLNHFREKLHTLITDEKLYEQLSKRAVKEAAQHYSSLSFAKKLENIYRQSIATNPKNEHKIPYLKQSRMNQ